MPRHPQLYAWTQRIATHAPDHPPAQVAALAEWSFGLVLAHACGLSAVAVALAAVLGQAVNTTRQRLREWYQPAAAKAGRGRTELDPAGWTGPLVRWVTAGWAERRVALALDVTNLGDRFHVLTAAVVYRGCGIPVAWAVLAGGAEDPWNPHWDRLLGRVAEALGPGWQVVVLTDRGLESADLFRAITARGFHPLMRAKAGGVVPPGRVAPVPPPGRVRGPGRGPVRGGRDGVPDGPAGLYPVGVPGGRVCGRLAGADRPPARGGRPVLVRPPELGRAGVQGDQAGRVAVAAGPDDGPGSGGAGLGGGRRRDAVAGGGGWAGRGGAAAGDRPPVPGGRATPGPPVIPDRTGADPGRVACRGRPGRSVCPRAVARADSHPTGIGGGVHGSDDLPLKGGRG